MQCRTNVEDTGPTLYECYTNDLCLLGMAMVQVPITHTFTVLRPYFLTS